VLRFWGHAANVEGIEAGGIQISCTDFMSSTVEPILILFVGFKFNVNVLSWH
jgi:hypothetical protein